jgi:hypothetical protein
MQPPISGATKLALLTVLVSIRRPNYNYKIVWTVGKVGERIKEKNQKLHEAMGFTSEFVKKT